MCVCSRRGGGYIFAGNLIRHLVGGSPDQFVQFGHFQSEPIWLNERYFCVTTMYGFGVYDLNRAQDAVFYVEDTSYMGLEIVGPKPQNDTLSIRGEDITVSVGDTSTPMRLGENERLQLQYRFPADGTLRVEYSVVR